MKCTLVWQAIVIFLCVIASATAQGRSCQGVEFPDSVEAAGTSLTLNGLGVRKATVFKVSVYVAALYVGRASSNPGTILRSNTPVQLVMHFVRNVSAKDLRERWEEGFASNAPEQLPALKDRVAELNRWMTDVKSGQRMIFTRIPGAGIRVDLGGLTKGTIEGDDFANAFLSIWLGKPPNPELKSGLLGGECR